MGIIQDILTSVVPRRWAESMEAESRRWHIQCSCGCEQSIWDIGGVRWKAVGEPKTFRKCSACGRRSWHRIYFKPDGTESQPVETTR